MTKSVTNLFRYQQVINLRKSGKTFQEIADNLGVSRQRVFQIYSRAVKKFPGMTVNMPKKAA